MTKKAGLGFAVAVLAAGLFLQGCNQGSAEKAGENADSAIEQADGSGKDLSDGPAENAGEAMDKAAKDVGDAADKAAADVEKATDGH